jgi:hypothetical protein
MSVRDCKWGINAELGVLFQSVNTLDCERDDSKVNTWCAFTNTQVIYSFFFMEKEQ